MLETFQDLTNRIVQRVNDQRGMNNRLRDAVAPRQARKQFREMVKLAYDAGLAAGLQAEASMRLKGNKFLITVADSWFGQLTDEDLGVASLSENWQVMTERLPLHTSWHRLVYQKTEAQAVLLSQPVAATAVSLKEIALSLPEEVVTGVAGFISCPYDEDIIEDNVHNHSVLLIRGVGLLAQGDSMQQAIARSETINRWCEILICGTQIII